MNENNEKHVVFEADQFKNHPRYFQAPSSTSKMVQWVMKYSGGKIKDEKHASNILVGFMFMATIISIFLFIGLNVKSPKPVQYRKDIPADVRAKLPPGVWETIPLKFKSK